MSKVGPIPSGLDETRRALVRDNLGLVAVHLRRIPRRESLKSRRETEDLFQEGCLGLIRAAADFDPARGIPFAAFALPRINNAMSVAQRTQSSLIRPPRTDSRRKRDGGGESVDRHHPFPQTSALTGPQVERLSAGKRGNPAPPDEPEGETVGDRLRRKYERAVESVVAAEVEVGSHRGDRARLVELIARERLLIPAEEAKRPLRQIAKETDSSYGRVANCEQKLNAAVRETLGADPEFRRLKRLLHTDLSGPRRAVDERLERELASASAATFLNQFRAADRQGRARLLQELLAVSAEQLDAWVRDRFAELSGEQREELLRRSKGPVSATDKG